MKEYIEQALANIAYSITHATQKVWWTLLKQITRQTATNFSWVSFLNLGVFIFLVHRTFSISRLSCPFLARRRTKDADWGHWESERAGGWAHGGAGHQEGDEEQGLHRGAQRGQEDALAEHHQDRGWPTKPLEAAETQVQKTGIGLHHTGYIIYTWHDKKVLKIAPKITSESSEPTLTGLRRWTRGLRGDLGCWASGPPETLWGEVFSQIFIISSAVYQTWHGLCQIIERGPHWAGDYEEVQDAPGQETGYWQADHCGGGWGGGRRLGLETS